MGVLDAIIYQDSKGFHTIPIACIAKKKRHYNSYKGETSEILPS